MEEIYTNDVKNIVQFNLVPKVEPNDGEFVLCGEFVDGVPPASTTPVLRTEDSKDPLSEGSTADNKFGLKEFKIIVKDCLQELATITSDIKDEPEENNYDDSFASQEVDDRSTDEQITEHQTNAQPRTSWLYALNKARLTEELGKIGLPTKGNIEEQRRRLSNFIRRKNYQPMESKTPYPVSPVDPKSINGEPRTSWIYALNKAQRVEKLHKFGLPIKGSCHDQRRLLSEFIRTGCYRPTESKTTDPGTSATSATTPEDLNSAVKVSPSLIPTTSVSEGELRSPQSNSASLPETTLLPAKKRKKRSNYKEASSSESDHGESYSPKRSFISASSKKTSTVKKGKSNECRKTHLKTVPVKAETDGVLWSCCDMQFELFSAYNNHKSQVHLIEELKCSVCIDQSFPSIYEIEKHYLDVHTDSSWTSFHCLDCRLVFGVKSCFFYHKAKCCESQSVCSGILDSILDFVAARKKSKNPKVNEDTAFRLSCCENIIENFDDFVVHKFSDHNISLLTCGLCLCVKDTITQLKNHYQKFHFFKFWKRMDLKNCANHEKGAASKVSSITQIGDILIKADDGSSNSDNVRAKPVQCSALQDGILCQCCDCAKRLEETQSLNTIANRDSNQLNYPFQCEPCNLRFCYKSRLNRHLRTHEGVKRFPCDLCGSAFTERSTLEKHKLHKHSSNSIKEICSICDKVLQSKNILKVHMAKLHIRVNKKKIKVKCEHCEKVFARRSNYLRHIRSVHCVGEELKCDHCSKIFYVKDLLVYHMQRMHLPNEKHECQKCDRSFKSISGLRYHNYVKHSDIRFNCEVCGKMCTTNVRLEEHMAVHSDDKPFICQTCGKRFKRDVNLQQHQYTHSDSRPHVCTICGLKFSLKTHVKQHMAVHGIFKNHKCLICEKTFAKKVELKCHLSTHGI